jgi:hypothetical protein
MGLLRQLLGGPAAERDSVTLGGVPLPQQNEALHTLLAGSTGSGKTTLFTEALATLVGRGDRVIVVDPGGHHLAHFGQPGDIVLNPFDLRSPGWALANEVRKAFDYYRLAKSVIPDGQGADAAWHHYGQVLLCEGLRALMLRGENTTAALLHWLTVASTEELAGLLAGTPAQGLFDRDAGKALASTRFILTSYLTPHSYLREGDFSLRDWLASESGSLYITWREDMQSALMPLVGCWVDLLANAVLSLPPDPKRRLWLFLDELGGLGRLNSLESALTRGRKNGLCVMAGLQSTAQLDRNYGRESAIVLRSCFRNLVVLSLARSDPDTAEILSKALGEREVDRVQRSANSGAQGISKGASVQRATERIAMPSELAQLPNLTAYISWAGEEQVRLVEFAPQNWPVVAPAFEEVPC